MKKVLNLLLCVVVMTSMLVGCSGESSKEESDSKSTQNEEKKEPTYVLKFNHVLTDKDPYHQAYLKWAEGVSERTNGDLQIEVFNSSQLGVEEDIIEQIKQGANIGQNTDAARLGNYVPDIAVMNAPYFVESLDEVIQLGELETVKGWEKELADEHGIKVLSFDWVQGFRNILTNKPITKPEDLKGLQLRAPGAPVWQESIAAIGGTPVALAFSEMYSAIQTKTVDGCGNVYPSTYSSKLYEVLDYTSETQHILLINFAVISSDWFNKLPEEYQVILEEECEKAGKEVSAKIMGEYAEEAKKNLQDVGMTIIPHDEIDIEAFKAAAEQAYEKLGLTEARDKIYAELGK